MRAAVVATALYALAGCLRTPVHRCDEGTDCAGGACVIADGADHGLCAEVDEACGGGLRYADDAGDVAGTCVEGAPAPYDPCLAQGPLDAADACTIAVCEAMPRCCTHEWSELCRMEAERRCDARCGEVAAFGGGEDMVAGSGYLGVGRWNGDDYALFWAADVTDELIGAVAWGDFDGDLRPDLAACGADPDGGNRVHIYHATGDDPAFEEDPLSPIAIEGHCFGLTWIDLDADADLDLLYGTFVGLEWIQNQGDGVWAAPDDESFPFESMGILASIDAADLDRDGRLDIVIGPYDEPLRVFHNTTGGLVSYPAVPDLADGHWESVTFGDVDGDDVLDVLASGDTAFHVIANTDVDGGFAPGATPLFESNNPRDAVASAFVDVDEDGDLDVVVLATDYAMRVFENVDGGFAQLPSWDSDPTVGTEPPFVDPDHGALAVGDADGDGRVDLVACGTPGMCRMWLGAGDGTFEPEWAPSGSLDIQDVALTGAWPDILEAD